MKDSNLGSSVFAVVTVAVFAAGVFALGVAFAMLIR